ncbi:MAG TPA: adenylate/guanylate cyclase domain-containing protein [Spirochaetia bacterium]|nr:adenylate/guanylate cyclase domain-containing protein [Spirochaetia bacterium]
MSVRAKIVLVVLPIMITTIVLTGAASYSVASTGVTRIAREFLDFKASELQKYAESQWNLLVQANATGNPMMVQAAQNGVSTFAQSIVRSQTELIFAIDQDGNVQMSTKAVTVKPEEKAQLLELYKNHPTGLLSPTIAGVQRVAEGFFFPPFKWYILLTEERQTFYRDVNSITYTTLYIVLGAAAAAILLLLLFARHLTNPLSNMIRIMRQIISSNDLTERVPVEYRDETGTLAHTFNIMIGELERAYNQIKNYAFQAVLAQKKESRIRNIFQKYVPQELIDQFFRNPEAMLVGDNRVLSVLFSDIRSFTTISEGMRPDELVNSLNRYFSVMVDIIMAHGGIVDKYIGDAIMAFFGAPVRHEDDAYQSVLAGLEMADAVKVFNQEQISLGKPEFRIGVGINYGVVTVGNIGTEKKMDYTVIGDMVNLASRLEGLTKTYHQELLIAESLFVKVKDKVSWRFLDTVAVKGKTRGVKIYAVKKSLEPAEKAIWDIHNSAMDLYYAREFGKARGLFEEVLRTAPEDFMAQSMLERCRTYENEPPERNWTGVEVMLTK